MQLAIGAVFGFFILVILITICMRLALIAYKSAVFDRHMIYLEDIGNINPGKTRRLSELEPDSVVAISKSLRKGIGKMNKNWGRDRGCWTAEQNDEYYNLLDHHSEILENTLKTATEQQRIKNVGKTRFSKKIANKFAELIS